MAKDEKMKETKEENKKLPILANGRGLALRSMDDMWRFACAVRDSGLAPKSFTKPEQILIALQSGAELGLPPMRSLQSFCVINGAARLYGDAPLALVRQSGLMEYIKERIEGGGDSMTAICETKRKGDPEPIVTEFSVADAKDAGLWGKAGPWQNYKKRMLKYRARSFNLRDNFPDAFGGATIAEEYEGVEMPQEQATPQVPSRDERKQVEGVTVTDTKDVIRDELNIFIDKFLKMIEQDYGVQLYPDEHANLIKTAIAKFTSITLDDTETDYLKPANFTVEKIGKMTTALENELPEDVTDMLPTPFDKDEEAEKHLDEKLQEYKYRCVAGHYFDKPKKGAGKTKLCPKCLTEQIEQTEKAEATK